MSSSYPAPLRVRRELWQVMGLKTVFIVDDDVTNLTVCVNALSESYNVFSFSSGRLLLKRLEKQTPDLILLDIDMPWMSGFEVLKQIKAKESSKDIPVVFLTAKIDVDSELEGLTLGAIDYIFKPFSPLLLLKRIEVHLLIESQKRELTEFNNNLLAMVEAKTRTVVELQNAILSTMTKLIDCRDDITGGHIDRTQRYMDVLLNRGLDRGYFKEESPSWDLKLVVLSTQLHDVGKIAIKDSILLKPDKLSDEEFEEIKKHTTFGEDVITDVQRNTADHKFLEYAKVFAGTHHEKWDGSGYPRGLKGYEIPVLGRTMATVDVYDALVSDRPYKKGLPHEKAVSIISESRGTHFDPAITDLFLSVSDKFSEISGQMIVDRG